MRQCSLVNLFHAADPWPDYTADSTPRSKTIGHWKTLRVRKPRQTLKQKWSWIRIRISRFGSARLSDLSQNVLDSLSCRCQSLRWVSWKSAGTLGLGLGLGLGWGQNTYKNIFSYEKQFFAAQTPQKWCEKVDFTENRCDPGVLLILT